MASNFSTTQLFNNDNSQAVRVNPVERGQALLLALQALSQNMDLWLQQFYDSTDKLPADFLFDRVDTPALERDWT